LLTGSTGKVKGKCSYGAYGAPTCEGTTTTPLGYDAQYTSPDTGLVYLRARTYDPATAQFLSVDPIASLTRAPYSYADDNPLNYYDPTGLSGIFGTGIGPNVGPDIDWSEGGFWSTAAHLTLGVAGVGDTLATGITTAIATPICFAGVSTAPVIGQIAGYPACATFAVGGAKPGLHVALAHRSVDPVSRGLQAGEHNSDVHVLLDLHDQDITAWVSGR
jgi:RHS repeat-associated protein